MPMRRISLFYTSIHTAVIVLQPESAPYALPQIFIGGSAGD